MKNSIIKKVLNWITIMVIIIVIVIILIEILVIDKEKIINEKLLITLFNILILLIPYIGFIISFIGVKISIDIYKEAKSISSTIKFKDMYKKYKLEKDIIYKELEGVKRVVTSNNYKQLEGLLQVTICDCIEALTKLEVYVEVIKDNCDKDISLEINTMKNIIENNFQERDRTKFSSNLAVILGVLKTDIFVNEL